MKLNARELREAEEKEVQEQLKSRTRKPIYLILENVYDTYNVGGLFRLADALNASKIYLCGQTEIPPNQKIKKASIGTYKIVPWKHRKTAGEAIEELKSDVMVADDRSQMSDRRTQRSEIRNPTSDIQIIAIEQHSDAVEYTKCDYHLPVAFVVGNETSGVTPETLKLVDQIVEIPMWGVNKSLNVIVSAAIVVYWAILKSRDK